MGTIYQLVVVIAILISQILGLENVLGNEAHWPTLLGMYLGRKMWKLFY